MVKTVKISGKEFLIDGIKLNEKTFYNLTANKIRLKVNEGNYKIIRNPIDLKNEEPVSQHDLPIAIKIIKIKEHLEKGVILSKFQEIILENHPPVAKNNEYYICDEEYCRVRKKPYLVSPEVELLENGKIKYCYGFRSYP